MKPLLLFLGAIFFSQTTNSQTNPAAKCRPEGLIRNFSAGFAQNCSDNRLLITNTDSYTYPGIQGTEGKSEMEYPPAQSESQIKINDSSSEKYSGVRNNPDSINVEGVLAVNVDMLLGSSQRLSIDANQDLVAPVNDNFINAINLTSAIDASCTIGGTYTNVGATADQSKGMCWSGGPYSNVWYQFTASSTGFIDIQVKVSGAGETMRYPMVALWSGPISQLQCQNQQGYGNGSGNLSMSYSGLTPGSTYYIEVDNFTPWGSTGTFDLCLSDVPDYDYPVGAVDLSSAIDIACTTGGTYTNQYATADDGKGSCWSGGPYQNVWFKFTATSSSFINVHLNVGGAGETMRYAMVALWNSTLTTQLQCQNQQGYGYGATNLSMSYYGLTAGTTYYIEVDNFTPWGSTGTFDICLSDVTTYDYPQGAVDLTSAIDVTCVSGGTYSNQFATADDSKGSCWSGGPYQNVWFKFTATSSSFINVQLNVGGTGETMRYPMVALWNSTLTTQLQCQNQQGYGYGATNLSMSYYGLTPGTTYYIEVDNFTPWGSTGTFDICLSDVTTYDYPQGAVDLTGNIDAACSTGGTYSNQFATADDSKGSCWSGGPYQNVWFKFTASATGFINVQLNVGGTGETMRYPMVALWNSTLTTQLQCQNQQGYGYGATNLSMSYYGLTPGTTYYIEVDNFTPWGSTGTFDICLSDVTTYDYPQGAVDLTGNIDAACSTGGTYSNQFATADDSKGSCWSGGPYQNVWFKFTASATGFINVQLNVGGTGETMRYPMIAIWNSILGTQLQCQNQQGYGYGSTNLFMSYSGLTPGATYFIEVDNYTPWGSTGTFDICLTDYPGFDYPVGAVDLTGSMNGCSTGATYTNQFATADDSKGSCWSGGPYHNVWFKFTASPTTFINVQVIVNATGETMQYPMVALWDASLSTQLQCQNQQGYGNGSTNLSMNYYGLTPGSVYYIEVDNFTPWGSSGTFDICVNNQPDFDYPQGAVVLTNLNNYCSTGGTYSNSTATPDHSKGSCWSGGPYANVWFKFQAISSNVTASVEVSSTGETMRYPMMAIWDNTFTTQIACSNQAGYGNGAVNGTITYAGLTVGNWYYISVDNFTPWGSSGSFDICINNATSVTYYSIGTGDWSNTVNWSTTGFTGLSAGTIPAVGNPVNIQDHTITVSSTQSCAQVNMTASATATGLIINGGQLTVNGLFNQTNSGINEDIITSLQNSGTLIINDNANFSRSGGTNNFQLNLNSGSVMSVGQDMIWTSTGGTVQNNQMNLNGTATLAITRDLTLNSSGGMQILHSLNNSSTVSVGRDISFSANAAGLTEIDLNNSSGLSLKRNLVRTTPSYGTLNSGNNATLTFNGTATSQNFLSSAGTGGDAFTYTNVVINNTSGYSPAVILTGAASISGTLTLTAGVVGTTSANLLTLTPTAVSNPGNSASTSYISGPLTIQKNTTGSSVLNFPIGKTIDSRPVILTVNHSNNNLYNYKAEVFNASAYSLGYTLPASVDLVSSIHYWTINRTDNTGTSQPSSGLSGNQIIQLFFGYDDVVINGATTTIVKNTYLAPTTWFDIGGLGGPAYSGGANLSGSLTSISLPTSFNSFSTFTLGDLTEGLNPLPLILVGFNAILNKDKTVALAWSTEQEASGCFFTVERSMNEMNWQSIGSIQGKGNSSLPLNYVYTDAAPLNGANYYRIKMVTPMGKSIYTTEKEIDLLPGHGISVYPNPAREYVNVAVVQAPADLNIRLINAFGQVIHQAQVKGGTSKTFTLDVADYPKGTYLLQVTGADGTNDVFKLVIMR
jgi:hypothetical protein